MNEALFADVIVPLPFEKAFTYHIPANLEDQAMVGKRVIVQFGVRKYYTGIIKTLHNTMPTEYEVKEVVSFLDDYPIVTPFQVKFWEWIADYYLCTTGEVFKAALPSGLKLESQSKIYANPEFEDPEALKPDEALIIEVLEEQKALTITEISQLIPNKQAAPIIKSMLKKEAVFIYETVKQKYKPKTETIIEPTSDINNSDYVNGAFDKIKSAKKQKDLFLAYLQMAIQTEKGGEGKYITKKKLLEVTGSTDAVLKGLINKEVLVASKRKIDRFSFDQKHIKELNTLNEFQAKALDEIKEQFQEKQAVLLHGVTASGKTELYIHLINEQIDQGKQVLYLLPEIALTTQIVTRLKTFFGNKVGIYHSKFSDSERVEVWENVLNAEAENSYKLILGVRSSVFLPFSNLGLIIADEEHESTYKQFDPAPRYNARDAVQVLASTFNAKVLLGTATPSVESYYNALTGKFGLVELMKRHQDFSLPEIKVVDLKLSKKRKELYSFYSKKLLNDIEAVLNNNQQVILFQNRRGFSPIFQCNSCATIPTCRQCDVSLTYHKFSNSLVCHYCGHTEYNTGKCKACGSYELDMIGYGTERLEEELKLVLPNAKVGRMDLDTTRGKFAHEEIIHSFEQKKIDILIGTQMVTKGLDFDSVALVGIINADAMLNLPDFRAHERSFQMMTQVSGRAGRAGKKGEVLVQTSTPDHYIIRDVVNNDYKAFIKQQLAERKQFNYPPFCRFIRLTVKHRRKEILDKAADALAFSLRNTFGRRILGPEEPHVSRIQNLYIKNIIVKVERNKSFAKAKSIIKHEKGMLIQTPTFKTVQVIADVEPY